MIKGLFKNTRKNLADPKRIGEIAVINNLTSEANLVCELMETICLIKKFGNKKYNGIEDAKVVFYNKSQVESKYFKKKLSAGHVITVFLSNPDAFGISGRDFNSKKEVIDFFEIKNSPVGKVFIYDAQKQQNASISDSSKFFFGTTFFDTKIGLNFRPKLTRSQQEIWNEFFSNFNKKIVEIERALNNFRSETKIVGSGTPNRLTLACLKSEEQNTIIRPIAHIANGVDVLLHRRHAKGGNFISVSTKAQKLLPMLFAEFEKVEKGWSVTNNIIHTPHGSRTEMQFSEVFELIEKVAIEIELPKETSTSKQTEAA